MREDYTPAITLLEEILGRYSLPSFWTYSNPDETLDTQVDMSLHIFRNDWALERYQDLLKGIRDFKEKNGRAPRAPPLPEYVSDPRLDISLWCYKIELEFTPSPHEPNTTDKLKFPPKATGVTDLFYLFYGDGFHRDLTAVSTPEGTLSSVTFISHLIPEHEAVFASLVESHVRLGSALEYNDKKHEYYFRFRKRKPVLSGAVLDPLLTYLKGESEDET